MSALNTTMGATKNNKFPTKVAIVKRMPSPRNLKSKTSLAPKHRGSVHASHPAAPGSIPSVPVIFLHGIFMMSLRLIDGTSKSVEKA